MGLVKRGMSPKHAAVTAAQAAPVKVSRGIYAFIFFPGIKNSESCR